MQLSLPWVFCGPNWRADFPLVEQCFLINKEEYLTLHERGEEWREALAGRLIALGVEEPCLRLLRRRLPERPRMRLGFLFNGAAMALQWHAGLPPDRTTVLAPRGEPVFRALFEIEEAETGRLAARAALWLLRETLPELDWNAAGLEPGQDSGRAVELLVQRARSVRTPATGAAIAAAAKRAGLPCQNLAHAPYSIQPDADGNHPGFVLGQGVHARLLEASLPGAEDGLEQRAGALIAKLFPTGSPGRIPVVAVTGTNGKTTTCRMLDHILRESGLHTGLACSEGMYIDGRPTELHESAEQTLGMYHRLLIHPGIEAAVMEFFLSRIKRQGFPYDWCDVAIMTNVTPDHLDLGWETVEKVARTKRGVLERACEGVVLNADDPSTPRMLPHLRARRVALTTSVGDVKACHDQADRQAVWVGVEPVDGEETVVVYDGVIRVELAAVSALPSTFGGLARFNLENGLQAVAAGWLMGIEAPVLRTAMLSFEMGFDTTPGRLNVYDGLPFRVIMDYAHNEDGIRRLCELVDRMQVGGRRILMFSCTGDRRRDIWKNMTRAAAGHFDHFVCRNYRSTRGREPALIPGLMREWLEEAGVAPEAITICEDHEEAVQLSLHMAAPGDLLVLAAGIYEFGDMWASIKAGPQSNGRSALVSGNERP